MNDNHASDGTSALGSPLTAAGQSVAEQGFIRRYRLPLFLAVLAVCLYAGSILYILYGRGSGL